MSRSIIDLGLHVHKESVTIAVLPAAPTHARRPAAQIAGGLGGIPFELGHRAKLTVRASLASP